MPHPLCCRRALKLLVYSSKNSSDQGSNLRRHIHRHFFIGKIYRRFNQGRRTDQIPPALFRKNPQSTREKRLGLTTLAFRFRCYQIRKPLNLRQIQIAIQQGTSREFTRLRIPRKARLGDTGLDRSDDGDAAVDLQLHHILTRKAVRRIKSKHQCFIQDSPRSILELAQRKSARVGQVPG